MFRFSTIFLFCCLGLGLRGQSGAALNTDGSNDFVLVSNPFTAFTNEITVEWWVNVANFQIGSGISQASNNIDNMASNVWLMHGNVDGSLNWYVNDNGTWRFVNSGTPLTGTGWRHLAGVADANGTHLYVDGVLVASTTGILNGIRSNPSAALGMGRDVRYSFGRFMNGSFDEVRIWNRALCQSEIQARRNCQLQGNEPGLVGYYTFNQGIASANNAGLISLDDATGNGRTGQLFNFALNGASSNWIAPGGVNSLSNCAASAGPTAQRGQTLRFDGVNDHVRVPNPLSMVVSNELTMEAWVFPTAYGGNRIILNKEGEYEMAIFSDGSFQYAIAKPTPSWTWINTGAIIPLNRWTHIAVSVDNARARTYVNGVEVHSIAATGAFYDNHGPEDDFMIGNRQLSIQPLFLGEMDEVRIWNVSRTATQIRENMHLTLGRCQAGLVGYFQFNEGSGNVAGDAALGNHGTLTNMDLSTAWQVSGVNVGNDVNARSQTQNIPTGYSLQSFVLGNLNMAFSQQNLAQDFTVTYQSFTPNSLVGAAGSNIINNPVWTINRSSNTANTFVADYSFLFPSPLVTTDPSKYRLYWRPMFAHDQWQVIATASALSGNAITFRNIGLTGQFMVVVASDPLVTDVRGKMYELSATNDYINIPQNPQLNFGSGDFTYETWVKSTDQTTAWQCLWEYNDGFNIGLHVYLTGASNVLGGRLVYINAVELNGTSHRFVTPANIWTVNEWHHIAVVKTGTNFIFYVNGVAYPGISLGDPAVTAATIFRTAYNMQLGIRRTGAGSLPLRGSIDEVRFWSLARSQNEIRENMHLTLNGQETGLVAYYQFNSDQVPGTVGGVLDAKGIHHGTTINVPASRYLASEVAVAGGHSDRLTVNAAGLANFPSTGVNINFGTSPNGEIVVSRLRTERPHGWESITQGDVDNEYFVVWNYGSNANPVVNSMRFGQLNYIAPADAAAPNVFDLYRRGSRQFGPTWATAIDQGDAATAGTNGSITFSASPLTTGFSQFVIATNEPNPSMLPLVLLDFQAQRRNAQWVDLSWQTTSETDGLGFELERSLGQDFEKIAEVAAKGQASEYTWADPHAHEGWTYYRLKLLNKDGSFEYSAIRAVAGLSSQTAKLYPNPSREWIRVEGLSLSGKLQARIFANDGRLLRAWSIESEQIQLNVQELSSGLYRLILEDEQGARQEFAFERQ